MVLAAYGPSNLQVALFATSQILGCESLSRMCLSLQGHALAAMGLLCLWDLSSPAMPITVLVSEGSPSACAFLTATGRDHLVLAGMLPEV